MLLLKTKDPKYSLKLFKIVAYEYSSTISGRLRIVRVWDWCFEYQRTWPNEEGIFEPLAAGGRNKSLKVLHPFLVHYCDVSDVVTSNILSTILNGEVCVDP